MMGIREWLWSLLRDNCEVCHGKQGGVRGNENVLTLMDGSEVVMCDYCHSDWTKDDASRSHWLLLQDEKQERLND